MRIRKLVLPVAGLGTRLHPLTHKTPKALISVGGKPLIQYVLEEAAKSGFEDVILVASRKHIPHFKEYLAGARKRFGNLNFNLRTQKNVYGNGVAVLEAGDLVGDEPFAVRYCDDILMHHEPALKTLVDLFSKYRSSLITLEAVPKKLIANYGVVAVKRSINESLHEISMLVEKPKVKEMANIENLSNLTVVGAYVLTPSAMNHLRNMAVTAPPIKDSLTLNIAFHHEMASGKPVFGWVFPGRRFDCGEIGGLKTADAILSIPGR